MRKKYIFLTLGILIFLVTLNYQVALVSAVFNISNIDSWSEDKGAFTKFESLKDSEKLGTWEKATAEQKKNFIEKYSETKGKKVIFDGFQSKDLKWYKNQLYIQNGNKWVSVDFDNLRQTLKSIVYDEATKTMTYEFEKDYGTEKISNKIKIDDGFVDKDGYLTKFSKGGFMSSDKSKKIAVVTYGNGFLEYKDGAFIISKGSSNRGIYIGNHFYSQSEKADETIIKLGSKITDPIRLFNAKVNLMDKQGAEYASATLYTGYGRNNGEPKFVSLFFDQKKVPQDYKEPYVSVDLTAKYAVLNDNKKNTGQDIYMQLNLFSDFKSVSGTGTQTWVKNGEAMFNFQNGKMLFQEGTNKGAFEIDSIFNIANTDPNQHVFSYKKYKDNTYSDFFDKDLTVVQSGMLVSETSGMYVHGPRGRILGGQSETGYSDVKYDQEYLEGYFDGTEEERLAAIAKDKNTVVSVHGTSSISLPGQYVATEILSNLDYQMAVAELEMGGKEKMDAQLNGMNLLVAKRDLTDSQVRGDVANRLIEGFSVGNVQIINGLKSLMTKENPQVTDFEIQQRAQQLIDAYVIKTNYKADYDYSSVTAENIGQMQSVNRLLYELSVNHRGEVYIPEQASLRARPSSSGGISELQFRGDGIYVDGQQIPGVHPLVATAFRNTFADSLLNFEQTVAKRQANNQKYGTQINQAGYAFDINDYKTQRQESEVFYSRIIGARQVGQYALETARGKVGDKQSKYDYYTSKGRLP